MCEGYVTASHIRTRARADDAVRDVREKATTGLTELSTSIARPFAVRAPPHCRDLEAASRLSYGFIEICNASRMSDV